MRKQLNVRSDDAHRIAKRLARRLNISTTQVVEQALVDMERRVGDRVEPELTPEQRAEHDAFMDLVRRAQPRLVPGATFSDHDLYDENGLPR